MANLFWGCHCLSNHCKGFTFLDEDRFLPEKFRGKVFSLQMLEFAYVTHSSTPTLGITKCLKQLHSHLKLCWIHNTLFKKCLCHWHLKETQQSSHHAIKRSLQLWWKRTAAMTERQWYQHAIFNFFSPSGSAFLNVPQLVTEISIRYWWSVACCDGSGPAFRQSARE